MEHDLLYLCSHHIIGLRSTEINPRTSCVFPQNLSSHKTSGTYSKWCCYSHLRSWYY